MPMQLQIITAERELFSGEVDALVAPGIAGQLGILPRHAPLMTSLQPGELMVRADGKNRTWRYPAVIWKCWATG